jgi:hypothetical protein
MPSAFPLSRQRPQKPALLSLWGIFGEATMPLTRGQDVGYDMERMAYEFTMLDRNTPVKCAISSAALVDLAGDRWKRHPSDRGVQFEQFRDQIERMASDIFDATPVAERKVIRIFAKHLTKTNVAS